MSGIRGVCASFAFALLTACAGSTAASPEGLEAGAADAPPATAPELEVPTATETPNPETPDAATPDTALIPANPADTAPAESGATTNEDVEPMTPTPTTAPEPTPASVPTAESAPDCMRLTEFALDAENFGWFIVNDNVMGGRSSGGPVFENSTMVFEGAINTDGGGFSSVRAQIAPTTLAGYTHVIVRARPDERTYKVTLEDALGTRDRRISQQQELVFGEPDDDGWRTARIDFDQLDPRIFGRGVESDPFRPDLATQLGIMISDGVDGPFRIEIDWIDACR